MGKADHGNVSGHRPMRAARGRLLAAALLALVAGFGALGGASATSAQPTLPEADVRLVGVVAAAPPAGGATTASEMRYQLTIQNLGPDVVPADGIALLVFVDRADSTDPATIEVSRFVSNGLRDLPGNACGIGSHALLRCTNRQPIQPDGEIRLDIEHRHPAAVDGQVSFVAEISPRANTYTDGNAGNNSFRGPSYSFQNPPTTTTTTTSTTSTTVASSTSSTDPGSSTSSSTSTTVDPSSTTTTASTTATTPTTTTSTTPTTTATTQPTSSVELRSGSQASLVQQSTSTSELVAEVSGGASEDVEAAFGPEAEGDGSPPYLVLGGALAGLVLIGGVALATYMYYFREPDPPLVDIRRYH